MKAIEWIERVKKQAGIESDYGAAKLLGLSKQAISTYRARGSTLDEEAAKKVASALKIPAMGIVMDQAAEKIKDDEIRTALLAEARRLCILC